MIEHSKSRRWRIAAVLAVLLSITLGVLKVQIQRAHPPDWALDGTHLYEGYPSIDWFCFRVEWLRGTIEGTMNQAYSEWRPEDRLHAGAWLVPLLVAVTSKLTGSIPVAFQVLSALAIALLCLGIHRFVRSARATEDDEDDDDTVSSLAVIAFAAHVLVCRTAGHLYFDPFVALWMLASLGASLRYARTGSHVVRLAAIQTTGLFLKSSFLPALAIPVLAAWFVDGSRTEQRRIVARSLWCFVLPPIAIYLTFMAWSHGSAFQSTADMQHLATTWRLDSAQLRAFGIEMLMLFQWLPLGVLWTRPWKNRRGRIALLSGGIVLVATWSFGLPAIGRLYLPALMFGIMGVFACSEEKLAPRHWNSIVLVFACANYAVVAFGLWQLTR
ncbi:MAG: hypothetical protein H6832_05110 [Planctomycetes bacterium]|nr:hypothetical protein [Planctomycetota bacterium]MCB9917760.1 hypothetical protein [Planctomycetota bacterium]